MVKIKTTHVGSLPRSNELSSLLASKDNQEKIDISSFDAVVKKNVSEVVKKQINTGIDSVSDGEMSKISYATYIKDRVDGFSGEINYFNQLFNYSGNDTIYISDKDSHELSFSFKTSDGGQINKKGRKDNKLLSG